jgi:hypothetical protein
MRIISTLGSKLFVASTLWNLRLSTEEVLIIFYQVKKIMTIPLPRINPKEETKPKPEIQYEEEEEEW